MSEKKTGFTRSADLKRRVLDETTRKRRQLRQLEALEKDNFHDDPHAAFAHLTAKAKLPAFADGMEGKKRKKTRSNADHFKQRFRKTFQTLLEELSTEAREKPSYLTAIAPPSKFPPRHFCAVCGFPSNYTCITCGARYCCVKCLGTHQDTRFATSEASPVPSPPPQLSSLVVQVISATSNESCGGELIRT